MGKEFIYIEKPLTYVQETEGLTKQPKEMDKALADKDKLDKEMSKIKSEEVKKADPKGIAQWSTY